MQTFHSNQTAPELCIVGSSCVYYQDEMKYLEIEQGLHLIPWMGNTSLLVDRYDARVFLDDQSKFCLKSNLKFKPSEEEIQLELKCDEERYLELNVELSEIEIGREEEEKRQLGKFAQIPFTYETDSKIGTNYQKLDNQNKQQPIEQPTNQITDFTPYKPKPELYIPSSITTPGTERMHNIIVKTATHVAEKGNQLEIIIKIKQQYNSSFDFLNFDHFLCPYYKHIKQLISSGAYKPKIETQSEEKEPQPQQQQEIQAHSRPAPVYLGYIPPQYVSALNIPQGIHGNQEPIIQTETNLREEQTADRSQSSSCSDEGTELHPILRTGSSNKFKPIPKLKAKRRQKAKLFLERIKNESKTADFKRGTNQNIGNDNTTQNMHYQGSEGYIHMTPPPPDIQQLIDKVAYQVVTSEDEYFEKRLKEGGNSIYDFLYPSNQYNAYFRTKKIYFQKNFKLPQKTKSKETRQPKPISFSFHGSISNNMELEPRVYLGGDSTSDEDDNVKEDNVLIEKQETQKDTIGDNVQKSRKKRVAEFMQKIREKKSKRTEIATLSGDETNTQIYAPAYPTQELERKIYQQSPITYTANNDEVVKPDPRPGSDWVTLSANLNPQGRKVTEEILSKIRSSMN